MAGHSKWANIKHRKAAVDNKRGKLFTKVIREISVAVKEGGEDPEANPRLRLAMQNAKKVNMPKDSIQRAITKAAGGEGEDYIEATYEGYAANGVAVLVEAQTDNLNRTVANIRHHFSKGGGSLGTSGSVSYLFDKKGVFTIQLEDLSMAKEDLEPEVIDAGAEDIEQDGDTITVYSAFEDFGPLNDKLAELGIEPQNASVQYLPRTTVELSLENAQKVLRLIDNLEEDDDVQNVYHNLAMTGELEAHLTGS